MNCDITVCFYKVVSLWQPSFPSQIIDNTLQQLLLLFFLGRGGGSLERIHGMPIHFNGDRLLEIGFFFFFFLLQAWSRNQLNWYFKAPLY